MEMVPLKLKSKSGIRELFLMQSIITSTMSTCKLNVSVYFYKFKPSAKDILYLYLNKLPVLFSLTIMSSAVYF